MRFRKLGATLGTALFLGAGITQTVAVSPASAAPTGAAIVAGADQPTDPRDFRQGYRDGYYAGWRMAREECRMMRTYAFRHNDREDDYARGYDRGFGRGFDRGFREYCD